MSDASELREAARRIRHDVEFGQAYGNDTFLLAVADWLDLEAGLWERSSWYPDSPESLAVARAYLGRADA